jgi:nicotinic acid mononucleotide adenylyltransferase
LGRILLFIFFTTVVPIAGASAVILPYQELHTHWRGALTGRELIDAAIADPDVTYPARLLAELGIAVPPPGQNQDQDQNQDQNQGEIPLHALPPQSLDILDRAMTMNGGGFNGLETAYKYRHPLTSFSPRLLKYYETLIRTLARSFARQGVGYAEVSGSSAILRPEWLPLMARILPQIESATGVRLRFIVGIRRDAGPDRIRQIIAEIRAALPANPYIIGADFLGEEVNSTAEFADMIAELAALQRQRPGFQVRVHAGENGLFRENIKVAIRNGATRIGHGIYGLDDETLRLARDHNVIVEFNPTSNQALGYVAGTQEIPVPRYHAHGVRTKVGTDGAGIFMTSLPSEIQKMVAIHGKAVVAGREGEHVVFIPGSFDPPTKGHREMFLAAFERYHTGHLVIMINRYSGSKDYLADFNQRREMILAMLPLYYHSRVRIIPEPAAGGADAVVAELTGRNPKDIVLTLIGEDALYPDEVPLPDNHHYKIIARPGQAKKLSVMPKNGELISLNGTDGMSSSMARAAVRANDDKGILNTLEPGVIAVIRREGLYESPAPLVAERRAAAYAAAFEEFKARVRNDPAGIDVDRIEIPEFNPIQSPGQWESKFQRALHGSLPANVRAKSPCGDILAG